MVTAIASAPWRTAPILAYAEKGRTLLERLDPATRARVLAALAALVILGLGMVVLAWLGARMTRRYMRRFERPPRQASQRADSQQDDWARKPLTSQAGPQDDAMPKE
jgi:hypothetical protein